MKRFRYLLHSTLILCCWCLFATTATAETYYTSSIQRSKFLQRSDGDNNYETLLYRTMEDRRAAIVWKLGMSGESLSTAGNIQSQVVTFGPRAKMRYRLLENLEIRANAKLDLQRGRAQSLFGDIEPDSGVYVRDAKVRFSPFQEDFAMDVDGGIISQSSFNNPLFVKRLGFPGFRQAVTYRFNRDFHLGFAAQQLIPTSATLSTRVQDREALPTLHTETLEAFYRISNWNWVRGRFSLFDYDDLPSNVAYNSWLQGNTCAGFGGICGSINNSSFAYDFQGWMTQLTFEQKITENLAGQFKIDQIRNLKAPDTRNESRIMNLIIAYDTGRWILEPGYELFFSESDPVPAVYNDYLRGHNNREGWGAHFDLESKDYNFKIGMVYYEASLLNPGRLTDGFQQDNLRTLMLTLETAYDAI